MNKTVLLFTAAILLTVSAGCTSGGTNAEESSVSENVLTADTGIDYQAMKQRSGTMLDISQQPGGDMTMEEFEKNTTTYTVSYSGTVTFSKDNTTKELSDSDYQLVCTYAKKLCEGTLSAPYREDGADMPSYNINAYDADGQQTHLHLSSMESQTEFDTVYLLLRDYFSE